MKKFISFFALLALVTVGLSLSSCSDDDDKTKDVTITEQNLPQTAQTFIATFFPAQQVTKVVREIDDNTASYEVLFASGFKVEFDENGNWTSVDAPANKEIPMGIAPDAIAAYVNDNYASSPINEISRDDEGYEIELTNGVELAFNTEGQLISTGK